jgi:hypothetical protein
MKANPFYIVIYIVLIIALILISFYVIKFLYIVSCAPLINDTFGPLRDYVIYDKQPVMWLPILVYNIINFPPLHKLYVIILCIAAFVLLIIIACWLIGLILQNIIFSNPFYNIPPWRELREEGFFDWLLEKNEIQKNKDVVRFILNIFKSVLTPEQYKAAEERCLGTGGAASEKEATTGDFAALVGADAANDVLASVEEELEAADEATGASDALEAAGDAAEAADEATGASAAAEGAGASADKLIEGFVGKGRGSADAASKSALAAFAKAFSIPQPYTEYIDYNLEKIYKDDGREKDIFYRNSYLSIRHRAEANSYRNMNIARPDIDAILPELPDVENIIKNEVNYVNLKYG